MLVIKAIDAWLEMLGEATEPVCIHAPLQKVQAFTLQGGPPHRSTNDEGYTKCEKKTSRSPLDICPMRQGRQVTSAAVVARLWATEQGKAVNHRDQRDDREDEGQPPVAPGSTRGDG